MLLVGADVVTPDAVLPAAWVLVEHGSISAIGPENPPPLRDVVDLTGKTLLPGFIDLHVHGGGGAGYDDGAAAITTGLNLHLQHGTTRSLVSLISAPPVDMRGAITAAAGLARADPRVLGIHLEGPFLSPRRRGAHDATVLRDPDPVLLDDFQSAADGRLAVVTVAPELPGGLELIEKLVAAGVIAAVGHSDADYQTAYRAFAAGATLVTHAFNAMRPLHHRDPGIIGAAMDAGVVLEVINDGVHLHPAAIRLLHRLTPGRIALVTDAMAAGGAADGTYNLGSGEVTVREGVATLADGTIAGSTLTLDVAVQRAVRIVGFSLIDAVNAASLVPATVLGVSDRFGSIAVGRKADLVVVDAQLNVEAVLLGGHWAREAAV
jgi:N-acetylglucosamine-6-phosphate deacetylase